MATYWLSFRIADDAGYSDRYDKLIETVKALKTGNNWWFETTSFFIFDSEHNADGIAASVKKAISPTVDIAILGMTDFKTARAIGAVKDQDIFTLVPFMKKA